ncbi:hypothetical protein T4A_1849 [Trichinella pseudospiralis]|uniref:Uncharacterized protein n=1 Tax=Trichinella pseudospiralis TaxID=6337 RepID=A0A0V1DTK0_TRIPS|nr:hypothetical protein T4A_12261 [Trichinella pseudospiralis]KRY76436.1 hypothetical protein T4A_1849 [Trichinella pseudospiralis]
MFRNYVDVLGKLSSQLIITWLEKRWKQRHPYDDSGVFSQTTSKETKIRNISGVLATLENISSLPAPFSQEVVRLSVSTDCRPFLVQNAMSVDTSLKIDVCMPLHITVIPCYYQTLSHSLESWTISSWKRGPEITPPAFLTHPITFWDGKSPTGMPGGEIPLQCFLLISSHFGKISHQGDCGGANICSYTFCLSHDILGQLITKRNAGR